MNHKLIKTGGYSEREKIRSISGNATFKVKREIGKSMISVAEFDINALNTKYQGIENTSDNPEYSEEMLLEALAVFSGVTLSAYADTLDIDLLEASVSAEGRIEEKQSEKNNAAGKIKFQNVNLLFSLKTNATHEQIKSLFKSIKSYRETYKRLINSQSIRISYNMK